MSPHRRLVHVSLIELTMTVDMLTLIMDQPPPYTIVVVTGDRDLSLTLAILRLRRYKVILVCPSHADESLVMQADESVDWGSRVLGINDDDDGSSSSSSSSSGSSSSSSSTGALSYASFTSPHKIQKSATARRANSRTIKPSKGPKPEHVSPGREIQRSQKGRPLPEPKDGGDEADVLSAASPRASTPNAIFRPNFPVIRGEQETALTLSTSAGNIPTEMQTRKSTGVTATNSQPRARSGTISDSFFPPVPRFPLESYPQANASTPTEQKALRNSPSTQSTEGFSVVDHPVPRRMSDGLSNLTSAGSGNTPPITTTSAQAPETANPPTADPPTSLKLSPRLAPLPTGRSTLMRQTVILTTPYAGVPHNAVISQAPVTLAPVAGVPTAATSSPPTTTRPATAPTSAPTTSVAPLLSTPQATLPANIAGSPLAPRTSTTARTSASQNTTVSITSGHPLDKHRLLVRHLQAYRRRGELWPNQSLVAAAIVHEDNQFYKSVKATKWGQYASQAIADGIIRKQGDKIYLQDQWVNVIV